MLTNPNNILWWYFCFWIYLMFSDCKAPVFSGIPDTEQGFPVQRPNSTGSTSYVSSCSHSSSSSSSGRGSVSPVGCHIGLSRRIVSVSDPGRFSSPGEHDLDQENVRQNQLGKALIKLYMLCGHFLSWFILKGIKAILLVSEHLYTEQM